MNLNGAAIAQIKAELQPEESHQVIIRTTADDAGVYRFSNLPPGRYTLRLFSPGFSSLTVQSIGLAEGQQKSIPPLRLTVISLNCSGGPVAKHLQLLTERTRLGNFGGTVTLDLGPLKGNTPPLARAAVALLCSGKICGTTKTNERGEFMFKAIAAGLYDVDVSRAGFYPVQQLGFEVQEGSEAIYFPISLEHCPKGNCDPKLRRKKPLNICE